MISKEYDIVIIGGGPAGLAAGLYASRGNVQTIILEKLIPGLTDCSGILGNDIWCMSVWKELVALGIHFGIDRKLVSKQSFRNKLLPN